MSKHYPITGRTLDHLWNLMHALNKETLPATVQGQFKQVYDQLLTHDLEQAEGLTARTRTLAKHNKRRNCELEIDTDAVVSWGGEEGAYVMCWTWVEGVMDDDEESEIGP